MRIASALIGGAAAVAGLLALAAGERALPFAATHKITPTCFWVERPWVRAVGPALAPGAAIGEWVGIIAPRDRRGAAEPEARACFMRRGGWGKPEDLRVIMTRWPTPAQLAAWK